MTLTLYGNHLPFLIWPLQMQLAKEVLEGRGAQVHDSSSFKKGQIRGEKTMWLWRQKWE